MARRNPARIKRYIIVLVTNKFAGGKGYVVAFDPEYGTWKVAADRKAAIRGTKINMQDTSRHVLDCVQRGGDWDTKVYLESA